MGNTGQRRSTDAQEEEEEKQKEEKEEEEEKQEEEKERCGLGILCQIQFIGQFQHQCLLKTYKAPFSLSKSNDWK